MLVRIQAPMSTDEVISLDTVKSLINVDTSAHDDKLRLLISAAISRLDGAEGIIGRALAPQTWQLNLCKWPENAILIPLPPLIAVTSIKYLDSNGEEQTLASSYYRVVDADSLRSYIVPSVSTDSFGNFPTLIDNQPDAVRVTFDCGYRDLQSPANAAVNDILKLAIAFMVQSWYDMPGREDVPGVVRTLTAPLKVNRLGNIYSQ